MNPSPEARRIAQVFPNLTLDDLRWLAEQLRGFGAGPTGVREPRRPIRPLDARGIARDSVTGKIDLA